MGIPKGIIPFGGVQGRRPWPPETFAKKALPAEPVPRAALAVGVGVPQMWRRCMRRSSLLLQACGGAADAVRRRQRRLPMANSGNSVISVPPIHSQLTSGFTEILNDARPSLSWPSTVE